MGSCGRGGEAWCLLGIQHSKMALDPLLRRSLECDHLDHRAVLLHCRSVAVLRRQRAVAAWSDLVARFWSGWARGLTRHPRSRRAVLPCGSRSGGPALSLSVAGLLGKADMIDSRFEALFACV